MVNDLLTCFVVGFILPSTLFFVLYVVRALKSYFSDAADLNME